MADISVHSIGSILNSVNESGSKATPGEIGNSFETVINEAMSKVSQVQEDVEKAVGELATGGDITEAVLAIEKADMSFQLMVEIRNKLLTTYDEVMKMQI